MQRLLHRQVGSRAGKTQFYTEYLSKLLNIQAKVKSNSACDDLYKIAGAAGDLLIFEEPEKPLLRRLLLGPASCKAVREAATSILVVRQPRWPIKRLLLVTRGQEIDDAAVAWALRLAQPTQAAITVLAVQPTMSAIMSQALYGYGLAGWMMTDTPLGRQLRWLATHFVDWRTRATLRFRPGSPGSQIRTEVAEGDYDLIIIAADSPRWWLRRIPGELVNPLLHWVDRSVLVVKPTASGQKSYQNRKIVSALSTHLP
jgi:nucleotide-binding universal stress UspA family protein